MNLLFADRDVCTVIDYIVPVREPVSALFFNGTEHLFQGDILQVQCHPLLLLCVQTDTTAQHQEQSQDTMFQAQMFLHVTFVLGY